MSDSKIDIPPRIGVTSETKPFDFVGEFKRRLEEAEDYQGPEREDVLRRLDAVGIGEVKKLVPASMFRQRKDNLSDTNASSVYGDASFIEVNFLIGDADDFEDKLNKEDFLKAKYASDKGYILKTDRKMYFVVDGEVSRDILGELDRDKDPRRPHSCARSFKEFLGRYGLKAIVGKVNSDSSFAKGWGGKAEVLIDGALLPPALTPDEYKRYADLEINWKKMSLENLQIGFWPDATGADLLRYSILVRSMEEAGIPVDHKKILEELKTQKAQENLR